MEGEKGKEEIEGMEGGREKKVGEMEYEYKGGKEEIKGEEGEWKGEKKEGGVWRGDKGVRGEEEDEVEKGGG